jgi:hypothetical protein
MIDAKLGNYNLIMSGVYVVQLLHGAALGLPSPLTHLTVELGQ